MLQMTPLWPSKEQADRGHWDRSKCIFASYGGPFPNLWLILVCRHAAVHLGRIYLFCLDKLSDCRDFCSAGIVLIGTVALYPPSVSTDG